MQRLASLIRPLMHAIVVLLLIIAAVPSNALEVHDGTGVGRQLQQASGQGQGRFPSNTPLGNGPTNGSINLEYLNYGVVMTPASGCVSLYLLFLSGVSGTGNYWSTANGQACTSTAMLDKHAMSLQHTT